MASEPYISSGKVMGRDTEQQDLFAFRKTRYEQGSSTWLFEAYLIEWVLRKDDQEDC